MAWQIKRHLDGEDEIRPPAPVSCPFDTYDQALDSLEGWRFEKPWEYGVFPVNGSGLTDVKSSVQIALKSARVFSTVIKKTLAAGKETLDPALVAGLSEAFDRIDGFCCNGYHPDEWKRWA